MNHRNVRVGVAVSTLGTRPLRPLLQSLASGSRIPDVVAISNQGELPLVVADEEWPFVVRIQQSEGGLSAGRNQALTLIADDVDLICFPNDDSRFATDTIEKASLLFSELNRPAALAGTLQEGQSARYILPSAGARLTRRTVWRAIEAATFVSADAFAKVGRFSTEIGTGTSTPWQSGEGTDLLLRMLQCDLRVISAPAIRVLGGGERRELSSKQYGTKVRAYSRGTGYVFSRHRYSLAAKVRLVAAPTLRLLLGRRSGQTLRVTVAQTVGRLEGLLGQTVDPYPRRK